MNRMFYGQHERKLDYKGRLGIPEELLTAGGEEWRRAVVIKDSSELPGPEGKLPSFMSLFDLETWRELLQSAHGNMDADEARLFMDRVVGEASTVDVDSSKRVTLPERLLQYANIERQAMVRVVGAFDHIEVWNPLIHVAHLEALDKEGVRIRSIADLARGRIREVG